MNLQVIGSYVDVIIFLGIGIAGVFYPHKFVRAGSEEERQKKIKVLKIASIVVLAAAVGRLVLKLI
jgi:hypothetical protein